MKKLGLAGLAGILLVLLGLMLGGGPTVMGLFERAAQVVGPDIAQAAAQGAWLPIQNNPCNAQMRLFFYDEDTMGSDDACGVASQESIAAYVKTGTLTLTNKTLTAPTITAPTITGAGTAALATVTTTGDITCTPDATGGNAGARSTFTGLPAVRMFTAAGVNGTTETSTGYMDDSPAGEWAAVEVSAPDITTGATATYWRVGAASLYVTFGSTATAGDGVTNATGNDNDDLTADESVGMWVRSTKALSSGALTWKCNETNSQAFSIPAIAAADKWTWVEVDITELAGATCDVTTSVSVLAGTTAPAGATIYIDGMIKWDGANEIAIGSNVQEDGVLGILTVTTTDGGTTSHAMAALVEWTDFAVNYQSSNDVLIPISDTSAKTLFGTVAY